MHLPSYIDYTLLDRSVTPQQIIAFVKKAQNFQCKAICIHSYFLDLVSKIKCNLILATVIDFPLGASLLTIKQNAAQQAIDHGADELDIVINASALASNDERAIRQEMEMIANLPVPCKLIVESAQLTEQQLRQVVTISLDYPIAFIKSSTGYFGGATKEAIKIIKEIVQDKKKIKASGGIRTQVDAQQFIQLGADRLGCSRLPLE